MHETDHFDASANMAGIAKQLTDLNDQVYTTNIILMRIYDLMMLSAQEATEHAGDVYGQHQAGKIIGPVPYLDMPDWVADE